jgi:hypothetical protein
MIVPEAPLYLDNAERCAHLAELADSQPAYRRFLRMEAAWRALALEQDWLDGEIPPGPIATPHTLPAQV